MKVISELALDSLRPEKKMWCGLCFANNLMVEDPRPAVPPVTRITLPLRSGMSRSGSYWFISRAIAFLLGAC